MTSVARIRTVRAILILMTAMRALLWGACAATLVMVGATVADLLVPLPLSMRAPVVVLAGVVGFSTAIALAWRDRHALSLARTALWLEERFPSLEFALVTSVDSARDITTNAVTDSAAEWIPTAWRRGSRALFVPIVAVTLIAIILGALPASAVARVRSPRTGDIVDRVAIGSRSRDGSRLTPVAAEITPPRYTKLQSFAIDDPSSIRAIVGSTIVLRGRGSSEGIVARIGPDSLSRVAASGADHWSVAITVPTRGIAIKLTDREFERIVVVEPIVDAEPVVVLTQPAHDSILRQPIGRIKLAAEATDDIGLVSAGFEYIVSSGEGESFTFRSGTIGAVRPGGTRAVLTASLSIDSLDLKGGDIIHLRAVARDANDVTGPGVGASETRTIRIARAGEYDSIAVEAAAPPEEEKSMVSQRMLIMLAEALEKRRPKLKRETLVSESRTIAVDQKRLRKAVGDVVFMRLGGEPSGEESNVGEAQSRAHSMEELLRRADSATNVSTEAIDFEGGESPVVAINKPLLEAYNAMWDASTELEVGAPGRALPHMRRALAAIERARASERLYLRGRPPQVVVDVGKARLQGKTKGESSIRTPLATSDSLTSAIEARFTRVVALLSRSPFAAADSLLLLHIDALDAKPDFAEAVGDAADAIRRGNRDTVMIALARARRALSGAALIRDSLGSWSPIP